MGHTKCRVLTCVSQENSHQAPSVAASELTHFHILRGWAASFVYSVYIEWVRSLGVRWKAESFNEIVSSHLQKDAWVFVWFHSYYYCVLQHVCTGFYCCQVWMPYAQIKRGKYCCMKTFASLLVSLPVWLQKTQSEAQGTQFKHIALK